MEASLILTFRQLDLTEEMQAIGGLGYSNKYQILGYTGALVTGLHVLGSQRTRKVGKLSVRKLIYRSKIRRFVLC
jgi:hypothetical protein